MSFEVFTQPWVQAWADKLRSSAAYRRSAMSWEGSLLLEMSADPVLGVAADRAVFLDLWHGDCRAGRLPDGDDHAAADFVIRASAAARLGGHFPGASEPHFPGAISL